MPSEITVDEVVRLAIASIEQHKHQLEVHGISNIVDRETAAAIANKLRAKGYKCKILDNLKSPEYAIMVMTKKTAI